VPGYRTIVEATGVFAARHLKPHTRAYDLGCSLGAGLLAVLAAVRDVDFELIGIDSSPAMLARCQEVMALELQQRKVALVEKDLRAVEVENASFVAMNFTLQFIPPEERLTVLQGLRRGMVKGAALLLSEKISHTASEEDTYHALLHEDFKRLQGYSELEIVKKRAALERVLVPEPLGVHRARLEKAGFRSSCTWFRCMNFASIVAYV
jgi:tRNA (cmo5U34)-methyltransferase